MRDETKPNRRLQIEDAAYAILGEKGYAGASMQAIARAAKASNETLYAWYGDKKGLMAAPIARNTDLVRVAQAETPDTDAMAQLARTGPVLLAMVLGPRAVADGSLRSGPRDPAALAALYLTHLIGDLQIRRVIGAMDPPTDAACHASVDAALALLLDVAA